MAGMNAVQNAVQSSLFDQPERQPPRQPQPNPAAVHLLNELIDTVPGVGADILAAVVGHQNGHGRVVASAVGEWWRG